MGAWEATYLPHAGSCMACRECFNPRHLIWAAPAAQHTDRAVAAVDSQAVDVWCCAAAAAGSACSCAHMHGTLTMLWLAWGQPAVNGCSGIAPVQVCACAVDEVICIVSCKRARCGVTRRMTCTAWQWQCDQGDCLQSKLVWPATKCFAVRVCQLPWHMRLEAV